MSNPFILIARDRFKESRVKKCYYFLLLIPSLSWGEDIKLSCDYIKEMIYEPDGQTSFSDIFENPNIFIFNDFDKSLTRYYDYGDKEYYLDNEQSNNTFHYFTYENISMNVTHSEILKLNRFTLDISGETFKDTTPKTMYAMNCEITK